MKATFELLPDEMVKVVIPSHASMTWKPGQHFFLKFSPRLLSSHPFTCTSLPSESKDGKVLEFYVRVRGGMTAKLAKMAASGGGIKSARAVVDGPYGGLERSLRTYDRVLLLAGGSGKAPHSHT